MRLRSKGADKDYFPDNGDLTYDVRRYGLSIDYKPSTNQLIGKAVIEASALTDLDEFSLDTVQMFHDDAAAAGFMLDSAGVSR